jgi:hypothetical protein
VWCVYVVSVACSHGYDPFHDHFVLPHLGLQTIPRLHNDYDPFRVAVSHCIHFIPSTHNKQSLASKVTRAHTSTEREERAGGRGGRGGNGGRGGRGAGEEGR